MNYAKPHFTLQFQDTTQWPCFSLFFVKRRFLIKLKFAKTLSIKDFVLSLVGCMTKSIHTDGIYFISFERIRNFVKGDCRMHFSSKLQQLNYVIKQTKYNITVPVYNSRQRFKSKHMYNQLRLPLPHVLLDLVCLFR